jgi:hypothetical protein
MYISQLVKTRKPHSGLLQLPSCLPHFLGCSFPLIHFLSSIIPSLLAIYYLSILVEVLLRLLTYREDLVWLYLVSKYHS